MRIKNTLIEIKILIDWEIKLCNSSEYKAKYKKMEIKKEHEKIRSRRHSILLEKEFLKYKLKKKLIENMRKCLKTAGQEFLKYPTQ